MPNSYFKMLPLLLPPTLPLYQTKPSVFILVYFIWGVNQNHNRIETSRRGSLLTTRMGGCQPTKPYCKETCMYVSANRKVRRKKLGSDLRKLNSNDKFCFFFWLKEKKVYLTKAFFFVKRNLTHSTIRYWR